MRMTTALVRRGVHFVAILSPVFRKSRGFEDPPAAGPRVRIPFPPAGSQQRTVRLLEAVRGEPVEHLVLWLMPITRGQGFQA